MKGDPVHIPGEPVAKRQPLILWGMPGSGKSTALEWLNTRLGIRGADTDALLTEAFGEPIPALIHRYGWSWFRREEHRVLRELLLDPPRVIATGGGTPCHCGNDALMLNAGEVVYLHVPPEILLQRLRSNPGERPLLRQTDSDLESTINHLFEERTPIYLQAHWIFLTDPEMAWLPALAGWILAR